MENPILRILDNLKKYYILGIKASTDGNTFYLLEVMFKNNELSIVNRFNSDTIDEKFKSHLNKDHPIILHVYGDKVISKQTENITGYRNNLIFKTNPDEYYFYEYHQDNQIFLSLTRKKLIDDIIASLNNDDKHVVHLTMGPYVLINLQPMIPSPSLSTSEYDIEFRDNKIISFSKSSSLNLIYTIGEDSINEKETALIASFLGYKYKNDKIVYDEEFLHNNRAEQAYKRKFKIAGATALTFILLVLVISHNLLNYYVQNLAEKESLYSVSQLTINNINSLNEELDLKEKILNSSRIVNNNYLTQYFVEIGNSVEPDITLNKIELLPVQKKIRSNEKINFYSTQILIYGETRDDESFNNWLKKMRKYGWLNKLEILDYDQVSKNRSDFFLKLSI